MKVNGSMVPICIREVLADGVLSVTGGELWPASNILGEILAKATNGSNMRDLIEW